MCQIGLFEGPRSGPCGSLLHLPCPAIFATQRLNYQSIADRPCSRFDANGTTINNRPDRLNIGLDLALGNTTGLEANASLGLGTTSIMDLSTRRGASTAELADAWHVNGLQAK